MKRVRLSRVDKEPAFPGLVRVSGTAVIVALCLLALGFGLLALTPVASAAGELEPFRPLMNVAPMLIGLGALLLLIGLVLWYVGSSFDKISLPALAVGGILVAVGAGGMIMAWVNGQNFGGGGPPPPGPTTHVANWNCNFATMAAAGPGGAHDAITEFPDSPFVAADGGTPDLNKVIATPILDLVGKRAVSDISIDDDAATTTAAYLDEDAFAHDVNCRLMNPVPAVGGGLQEIPIWGRISISRTTGTINNGSYADVFFCDTTAGIYVGFGAIADSGATPDAHDADHTYVSYTSSRLCGSPAPLVGDWVPLGTSDGDVDGEWIAAWWVLHFGFSDYTTPALGSTDVFMKVELGTDPNNPTYRGNVETLTIELNALARA